MSPATATLGITQIVARDNSSTFACSLATPSQISRSAHPGFLRGCNDCRPFGSVPQYRELQQRPHGAEARQHVANEPRESLAPHEPADEQQAILVPRHFDIRGKRPIDADTDDTDSIAGNPGFDRRPAHCVADADIRVESAKKPADIRAVDGMRVDDVQPVNRDDRRNAKCAGDGSQRSEDRIADVKQ